MKLEEYFRIKGTYELVDGLYNVEGSVTLIEDVDKLPCNFGIVTDYFYCSHNNLTSLEGCPTHVGGIFYCTNNNKLTSLKGCPTHVGDEIWCDDNLKSSKEYRQYMIMKELRS